MEKKSKSSHYLFLFIIILVTITSQITPKPGCLPPDNQTDLWCPGAQGIPPAIGDEIYKCYKIPCLIRTLPNGTLLAFIEARKYSCDDAGFIDLRLRRSFDNGKTWTQSQLIWSESTDKKYVTIGDASPIYDRKTGDVHVVFTRNNSDVFYTKSINDGETWSKPIDITAQVRSPNATGFIGTGHAAGLQLSTGRLLFPMHGPCHMVYSDDHGLTFQVGAKLTNGGECQVAEIRPGYIIVVARNTNTGFEFIAYSKDDGETWSASEQNKDLPSPIKGCEASIVQHPNGKLYFSGPESHILREHMIVKVSIDEGVSWQQHAVIWPLAAAYSALTVLGDDSTADLGLLYDRDNRTMIVFEAHAITFTSLKP